MTSKSLLHKVLALITNGSDSIEQDFIWMYDDKRRAYLDHIIYTIKLGKYSRTGKTDRFITNEAIFRIVNLIKQAGV